MIFLNCCYCYSVFNGKVFSNMRKTNLHILSRCDKRLEIICTSISVLWYCTYNIQCYLYSGPLLYKIRCYFFCCSSKCIQKIPYLYCFIYYLVLMLLILSRVVTNLVYNLPLCWSKLIFCFKDLLSSWWNCKYVYI